MKKVFTNTTIYTGKEFLTGISILVDEGKILGFVYDTDLPEDYAIHDLKGNNIAPAFIDLQIYGGNGLLFSSDPSIEAINATHEYCLSGGASKFLITIATNSKEVISNGISTVKKYLNEGGNGLFGLHLEGPWINPEKRGAHLLQHIRQPTMEDVKKLIEEAEGVVKMITLAPEKVDEKIIDYLRENKIVISAGHSNASYKKATEAFEKIKTTTHLFNAMSPFQSREPGMVGAIYNHPSVCSSIVADGIHVDFAAIQVSKKILGERLFLITDAVAETLEGPYLHILKNDRFVIPDDTLSGSTLTMMKAVKNCLQYCNIDLQEAIRMASLYPAKILGIENEFGLIERNYNASFVVFDNEMNVIEAVGFS
jgi:N-acetylglucosamine-6-phosphate deacetylase